MIRIGVIGYGYWGPNLVRNFADATATCVTAVCDMNEQRLEGVKKRYPGVLTCTSVPEILASSKVDAVAIATPVSTHFELGMQALRAGKHVLIEKPLATSSEEALCLIEEAEKRNLVLMVDHTFVYTGAVRKVKQLVDAGQLGRVYYYDSVRVNLGLFQNDIDVVWDLAVHDLAIMDFVLSAQPHTITASGMSHVKGGQENIAYITALCEGDLIAHINVNWLSPVKVRRTLIGGSRQMIVYDDMEPSEKVKVYDKGITVTNRPDSLYKMLIGYRTGDMHAPQLDMTEALRLEAQHFAECILRGTRPVTDGYAGLRVVRMLEAATQSMKRHGAPINLASDHVRAVAALA
jgi:predicted dehydrogenase